MIRKTILADFKPPSCPWGPCYHGVMLRGIRRAHYYIYTLLRRSASEMVTEL